uniref:Glucagon receptor n=1 Tax=Eptatretus burgeri TaxID=7764 RepID=A0A8C4NDF0_EPTBU
MPTIFWAGNFPQSAMESGVCPRDSLLAFHLLILATLLASGQADMDVIITKWKMYKEQCLKRFQALQPAQGLVCQRSFDSFACWPDTPAGALANVSCPFYLPWKELVQNGFVYRQCGNDGHWMRTNGSTIWRNSSECDKPTHWALAQKHEQQQLDDLRLLYMVGYSLSLCALLLALLILLTFRRLHCTRNCIHGNLFLSLLLRAFVTLVRDSLLNSHYGREFSELQEWTHAGLSGCRIAQTCAQYCAMANYFWLLVEGLYLLSLLISTAPSEASHFRYYLALGWGTPLLFVIPWVILRHVKDNKSCWTVNEHMGIWWIIRSPIIASILINFCLFVAILNILVSKLRMKHMGYTNYRFRLAKATLTLVALLGVQEIAFTFVVDEVARGSVRIIKFYFDVVFHSFQGLLVSLLYFFFNKEVQSELQKRWHRWRLIRALNTTARRASHPTPLTESWNQSLEPAHSTCLTGQSLSHDSSSMTASRVPSNSQGGGATTNNRNCEFILLPKPRWMSCTRNSSSVNSQPELTLQNCFSESKIDTERYICNHKGTPDGNVQQSCEVIVTHQSARSHPKIFRISTL